MLKYATVGVVFQEIPDEVTLSIFLTKCPCKCPGCHSKYLWEDTGEPLTTQVLEGLLLNYAHDITCVCLMGGDAEPTQVALLANFLHCKHPEYRVAWYSGRSYVPANIDKKAFDYIKLGPYIKHLGSLKSPTTNQKLYKQSSEGQFIDITSRFWNLQSEAQFDVINSSKNSKNFDCLSQ